jgi:exo-beta-1,3-glucanase (GH17 family)/cellulose synthase/poly-beta-1,6-N-acetylglucosamine synthase-like glycosyltransferase
VSYNPYRDKYTLNHNKDFVSEELIDADLAIIAKRFRCVRTYTTLHGMDMVPKIAEKYGLTVILGVWVSADLMENMHDLEIALKTANKYPAVTHLLVGNEAIYFDTVSPKYIYLYLKYAHSQTKKPISTGEIASTWNEERKLAELSDFIAIHIFPYWNNIPLDRSIDYLEGDYNFMTSLFPNKEVIVAETWWPSNGVDRGPSQANLLTQATYVRTITKYLEGRKIRYNIIEAFDQPWKIFGSEKHAGGSFGIFDDHGREKFALSGPLSLYGSSFMVRNLMQWVENIYTNIPSRYQESVRPYFSGDAVYIATKKLGIDSDIGLATSMIFLFIALFFGWFGAHLKPYAFFWGSLTFLGLTNIIVMIGYKAWIGHYIYLPQFWVNIPLMLLPIMGILYQLRDYLKIVGRGKIRNHITYDSLTPLRGSEPFVSLHIPSYNEEPEMLIRTIEHVLRLDYTNYELIIIENNTRDESVWRPVEKFVSELNKSHIRFYHFDELEWYKSGALNKALELTNPKADIIGLLDADYCVHPDWLTMTIWFFDDAHIAAVQCPQANNTTHATTFQKIMSYELDLFYKQGMIIRNESNAVIMNGTMCLIRRSILEAEKWCNGFICEDSELGLRIQSRGEKIIYIDHTFGEGLPPRNFEEYKKQRFRWAYGAMMIFKTHWKPIFLWSRLTFMQRFEYLFGWIGWWQMILYPFYLLILLFGSWFIYDSYSFEAPYDFALLTLFYIVFLMLSTVAIYRDRMHITLREAWLSVLASASLTVTIFRGVFLAIFWNNFGFKKTNKWGKHIAVGKIKWIKTHPIFILLVATNLAMIILSANILFRYGINTDTLIWFLLIVTVTLPTMGALFFQIIYE